MSQAAFFSRYGVPTEVIEVISEALPAPAPHEVLVDSIVAPINPADLNTLEGVYPAKLHPPAVPGVEGVGIVRTVGSAVPDALGLAEGVRVLLPHGYGTWRQAGVIEADRLMVVPPSVPLMEAAMLKINPATAWRMLHDFVTPEPGAWIAQNAANSAVGRCVIAMARELGLRTVNLVRRPEVIDELTALGADRVILDEGDTKAAIREAVGGKDVPLKLALNAVGGDSALKMAGALSEEGTLVSYGAMSRQAIKLPAGQLIFKDLRFRGFWVSRWYDHATAEERSAMFAALFDLAARGLIRTPVEQVYPISEAREAVRRAGESGRAGKILFGS